MNRDETYLKTILREISSIPSLMRGYNKESFLKSEKTQKAVCMTLLNIGELVKSLSDEFKQENKSVQWKEIAGLRDLAAHKYHSLNMERIWFTVKKDIPELKKSIYAIIDKK
ncbi:MAG: DUF86 domain-containing protein [Ruminiclostridium sp.]|nr:DUF86 domain-containing protein [Ruminiclostridium sp.]